MSDFTAVVDYGVGNLLSVTNALRYLGYKSEITGDPERLALASRIILPGVGAFPDAADSLRAAKLDGVIAAEAQKKPLLGICLGMQLLLEESDEVRPCRGLGLVEGSVRKIETSLKLPQIGWNSLTFKTPSPLFRGIPQGTYVYFVHSYCALPLRSGDVAAVTDYGASVVAAVARGNVFGCQFHPEKSGEAGLAILKNFGEMNR